MSGALHILRAPRGWLRREPLLWPERPGDVVLGGRAAVPWAGCRALLGWLGQSLGEERIWEALEPEHRDLRQVLGLGEPRPGSWELPWWGREGLAPPPGRAAWVRVLARLLPELDGVLSLPEVDHVDPASLDALRAAWAGLEQRPALRLGVEPRPPADLHGRRGHMLVMAEVLGFAGLPGAEVEERTGPAPGGPERRLQPPPMHPADDGLEVSAALALRSTHTAQALELGVRACRAAFAVGGDAGVLGVGLELLSFQEGLEGSARAELHALVALSATRRDPGSRDPELADFVEHHLGAALALEQRPDRRAFLLLRLARSACLRRGRCVEALAALDQGLEAAEHPEVPLEREGLVRGWLLWARCLALIGLERRAEAVVDVSLAWRCAEQALDTPEVCSAEAEPLRDAVLDTLAELSGWSEAHGVREGWQRALVVRDSQLPEPLRRGSRLAARALALNPRQLPQAEDLARRGLQAAVCAEDLGAEDHYAALLGEVRYRRGDAGEARRLFERCVALRLRAGAEEPLVDAALRAAAAACRAGAALEAHRLAGMALGLLPPYAPARRARVLALEARCLAHGGAPEAQGRLDEARAQALASRQPHTLLEVTLAAADVARALGQDDEALGAYRRAQGMLDGAQASAGARVVLAEGLAALGALEPSGLTALLPWIPAALHEPEVWWALPRLGPALLRLPGVEGSAGGQALAAACAARHDVAGAPARGAAPDQPPEAP